MKTLKNKVCYQRFIYRKDVQNNRDKIYIFGDNDKREGYGGQAKEMRGEPNAIGIRVKHSPDNKIGSFYSDKNYLRNVRKILDDFILVETELFLGKEIIIPEDGIGTGLAKLYEYAPHTLEFVDRCINYLFNKYS